MPTSAQIQHRGARRRPVVLLTLLALAGAACTASLGAGLARPSASSTSDGAYGWPVKPFDEPHPVRGVFADPRTSFDGAPTPAGLRGPGTFAFHQGVDISAPDGTAVYPVASGVAHLRSAETVVVTSEHGVAFEYWHIVPSVREGQRVTARETVLGRIRAGGYEHVHLTELRNGRAVNPLARGHLTPYADSTRPEVDAASYTDARTGRPLLPEFLRGRAALAVTASDRTSMPVPGRWNGLPVAPARITWHIERAKDGAVVVPEREAFDARETLPGSGLWSRYARGTRQNMANFAGHKMWRQPGVYLFRLTDSFDTTRLRDDIYVLVATASDVRGNAGTGSFVFTIHNKPGFFRR
jgi:murein DD-endopeptidase MepM/ murein hydrolase activator NlpD